MVKWNCERYTDDVVLIAKSEKDMKGILKRNIKKVQESFKKKRSVFEKSKVLVFENRIGRGKKRNFI